jgi:hypothetical protein
VIAGAAALAVALGPGYAGYDAAWALVWGGEIAHGELPSYTAPVAPTPHPLANAVAVVLSPLGDGGEAALVALTFLAFAALLAGVVALGTRLWCRSAGVAAAALLGTRGLLDREVAFASIDLPFLALLVWAAALEAGRERRGTAVLALLLLAGLLRPEAWLLSLVYLAWLATGARELRALRCATALALAAPLIWSLSDLVITGDPLHSFTGTRDLADELGRPTGVSTALSQLPSSLADLTRTLPLVAGLLGLGGGLGLARRRIALLSIVLACGLVTFLAIGVAGLPVLLRYLLVPAAVLAVTAGVGLTLATHAGTGRHRRAAAIVVSGVVGALLLASVPDTVDDVGGARAFTRAREEVQRDLRSLVAQPAFAAAAARCPEIRVPDFRTRPVLLLEHAIDADRVVVDNLADGERGLLLTYRSQRAADVFTLGAPGEVHLQALPAGGTLIARNRSWLADAVC